MVFGILIDVPLLIIPFVVMLIFRKRLVLAMGRKEDMPRASSAY